MTRLHRLLVLWLAVALAAIALSAGFVVAVDPFGYFGVNTAGYYYSSERQFKHTMVKGGDYNAIILGDSRIAYTDPSYIRLPQYKFLNGGMGGGTLSDQISVLVNSRLDELDLVVMGLNHRSLSVRGNCHANPAADDSPWDPIRFSAAWTQVWYAGATLHFKSTGLEPYYHADGTRVASGLRAADAALTEKTASYWNVLRREAEHLEELFQRWPGMVFPESCLARVELVQSLARQHGFRLVLVFLPMNRDLLDLQDWRSWSTNEHSRRSFKQLRAIVPNVVDFLDSGYSDSSNFWRSDPTHFKPEVGARLIEDAIRHSEDMEPAPRTENTAIEDAPAKQP